MSYKVIVTGVTGMVGEGVLMECLESPHISDVLTVSRKPTGRTHPKLKELIVPDFLTMTEDERLRGYDACFYCAGVSSVGMKEPEYTKMTFDTTIHFATVLAKLNPQMTFVYVSGASTDSTEKGKMMWARVKGKTENTLARMPFRNVHNFRPGFMQATPGQKHLPSFYKYLGWSFPFFKIVMPNGTSTLQQVARAMINTLVVGSDKPVLEVKDINALGNAG